MQNPITFGDHKKFLHGGNPFLKKTYKHLVQGIHSQTSLLYILLPNVQVYYI